LEKDTALKLKKEVEHLNEVVNCATWVAGGCLGFS
jgi:hypothetical protein